jgi:hypothetical protein
MSELSNRARGALQVVASFHESPGGREKRQGNEHEEKIQHNFS